MIKWHCIRCGNRLKIVSKNDPCHGAHCWTEMQRSGTTMFQCGNKQCYHEGAPLTLHHPSNTRAAANPPKQYSVSFLK